MDSLLSLHTPTPTPTTTSNNNNNNNLFPLSPPGLTPTPTTTFLVPKLEPLDDFFFHQQQPQQTQQQPQIQQPQQQNHDHHHPDSPPLLFPFPLDDNNTPDADVSDHDEDPDLYTQFFRVTDLFRVAFGQTPLRNDVVSDQNINLVDSLSLALNSHHHTIDVNDSAAVPDPDSRAIVPVPPPPPSPLEAAAAAANSSSAVAVATPKRGKKKELVRVSDLTVKDQLHFREVVRRTRMIYDSLRVLTSVEEEKRVSEEKRVQAERRVEEEKNRAESALIALAAAAAESAVASSPAAAATPAPDPSNDQQSTPINNNAGEVRGVAASLAAATRRVRLRGDLRAAALMRERGLWLNREKRIVGAIPGVYVGDLFLFRMELCVLGLHHQIQAGIDYLPAGMSPNGEPIATCVIVSGGYEDDMDDGEVITYTGHGGQATNSVRQASHQKLEGGNLALERSMHHGIEVRVIRGMKYEGSASKSGKVYVYDGLYRIVDCWFDVGKSGFGVYKYKLVRIEGQPRMGSAILKDARDVRKRGVDYKPLYCVSVDVSSKKEKVPVRVYNDIDDSTDPTSFEYLARTSFPPFVFHQSGTATGCDCVDSCADGCFCCMKNGGEFPYNQHGMLVRGKPLIFECGPFCRCPPSCRNRVTQNGLKNRLEVFRSRETGWGVRSLDLIQAGAFICEYTGIVLTREQAQILTMNGDSLIYPNRFSGRWAEWGDLSQIYSEYVRPSYPSIPPLDFSLDVSRMRNVACYMSHSSSPNVLVQFVLFDHNNLMFPHTMLFAMENIPPMRELSIDYGVPDEWTGKLSICNG